MAQPIYEYESFYISIRLDDDDRQVVTATVFYKRYKRSSDGKFLQHSLSPYAYDPKGQYIRYADWSQDDPPACPEWVLKAMAETVKRIKGFSMQEFTPETEKSG